MSFHREENIDSKNLKEFLLTLDRIADKYKLPIIFSTHPRTKKKITQLKLNINPLIQLLKPLNFSDYNSLQLNSLVTLSDSGTIS